MFSEAMAFVEQWEGGWSDDAADPGGLTKWGITIRTVIALALDFNRDGRVDEADLRDMTRDQARNVYRREYWDKVRAGELPGPVALLVFDAAVNQGVSRAGRFLQLAAGVASDGKIGPATLAAVRAKYAAAPRVLLREIAVRRALHYSSLAHFVRFGPGWYRRLFDAAMSAEAAR
jgi:lysozyme family protein